ncbi:MAG: NADH-quinone oxidoreductase subunit J [Chloroflexi bacterium]|nr:NADH-quinone oxidoreductase subunit J [Chloroflexota bacterium]
MIERSAIIDIVFWAVAALAIAASVMVVTVRDVFKASLFLAGSFVAAAGLYVLLRAEFLAAVQVLIYVGAISILIVFTVMLVRQVSGGNRSGGPFFAIAGGVAAVLVALAISYAAVNSKWSDLDRAAAGDERVAAALTGEYQAQQSPGNPDVDLVKVPIDDPEKARHGVFERTTNQLGTMFIRDYVLAFEIISIVLLAALIGALAIARGARDGGTS